MLLRSLIVLNIDRQDKRFSLQECDSAPASIEQKVLDYREAASRLRAVFEAVGAAGSGKGEGGARCEACAALADIQARVREISESVILVGAEGRRDATAGPDEAAARETGAQTDAADPAPATDADLKSVVHELKKDLADAESRQESEKLKLTDLVR